MKKVFVTLAMLAALIETNAQSVDSTQIAKDKILTPTTQTQILPVDTNKVIAPVDNFSGNIEFILGKKKKKDNQYYNTYIRVNLFYNLPRKITGYDWTEYYPDGTYCGRNTLSKTIATVIGTKNKPKLAIGLENQILYISGFPVSTGVGFDVQYSPTENILIKPYFTPELFDKHGIEKNKSITGICFSAKPFPNTKVLKNITVSGFGEMNFSAKIDKNDNGTTKDDKLAPTWLYGEGCVGFTIPSFAPTTSTADSHFTVE